MTCSRLAAFTLLAALAGASAAQAGTIYKWTDQRGVVNYSNAPPPEARGLTAINAGPAMTQVGSGLDEETRYWREQRTREQRTRELARDMREVESMRQRREAEQIRHEQYRHQLALAGQATSADDERRRFAREQCLRERRVDCDTAAGGVIPYAYYPAPVISRGSRQTIFQAAPFPVTGQTLGPAPGTIAGTQAQLAPFRAAAPMLNRSASARITR